MDLLTNLPYGPIRGGGLDPTLVLYHDFTRVASRLRGPDITFTRASTKTYFDALGVLQTAAINERAVNHAFVGGVWVPRGFRREGQATNHIRNNTGVGAVAGTPGTLPTNWGATLFIPAGVTQSVVGTGTENGIAYVDIRLNGTASGSGSILIQPEGLASITAATGQAWTFSSYLKLQAGSWANVSALAAVFREGTAASAFVAEGSVSLSLPTGSSLNQQRQTATRTLAGGGTVERVTPRIAITHTAAAIDLTLRIGLPQIEQASAASSAIPTTGVTVTRSADVASISGADFNGFYNQSEGTIVVTGYSLASGVRALLAFDDDTANERIELLTNSTDPRALVVDGGVTQADIDAGAVTAGTRFKLAFAYSANDFAACVNGGSVVTDNSGTLPTVDRVRFGVNQASDSLQNHIEAMQVYNTRKPNAFLQQVTA